MNTCSILAQILAFVHAVDSCLGIAISHVKECILAAAGSFREGRVSKRERRAILVPNAYVEIPNLLIPEDIS